MDSGGTADTGANAAFNHDAGLDATEQAAIAAVLGESSSSSAGPPQLPEVVPARRLAGSRVRHCVM